MNYLRIGTDYFKKVQVPLSEIENYESIVKWSKREIIQDHGRNYLKSVPKYDGFCNIPSHLHFKAEINAFYNLYHPLGHKAEKGDWRTIEQLLRHIFGDQFIRGLDYLTIIYREPTQVLPILALVSEERETGKTTFLQVMKLLFGKNLTINTNEDFRSRFNSDWAGKLVICIDEVLLDKRDDSERLKNLSTAKTYKQEAKGKDKQEIPFYGKIILCSNNEDNFVLIDNNEIRYWVRKVDSLKEEGKKVDPNFLSRIENEIPAFVYLLENRNIVTPKTSRMWFTKEQIHTEALEKLIKGTTSSLLREILEVLKDLFVISESDQLSYGGRDLVLVLKENGVNTTTRKINDTLRNKLKVEYKNGSYEKFTVKFNASNERYLDSITERGRHFVFERSIIDKF
ncbi:MAG: primase-helicase family protein [Nonlabens sp.]